MKCLSKNFLYHGDWGEVKFKSGKNNYTAKITTHKMLAVYHEEMKEEVKMDSLGEGMYTSMVLSTPMTPVLGQFYI